MCNLDRVNMSIAIMPMSRTFAWTSETMGLVQSSFFWGYLLTQIAGGVLADKIGGKVVLCWGVLWWSLATLVTPIAAYAGLVPLLVTRGMMGIGEGVAMPAMNALLAAWVPPRERSRAVSLVYSGMYIGSMLGLGISPGICESAGWPSVFYSFGTIGVLWAAVWLFLSSRGPADDLRISPQERAFLLARVLGPRSQTTSAAEREKEREREREKKVEDSIDESESEDEDMAASFDASGLLRKSERSMKERSAREVRPEKPPRERRRPAVIPWGKIFRTPAVWAIIVAHFCHNWGLFIILTWMPTYYNQVLGMDLAKSGLMSVLPWLTMAITANVGGWFADMLIQRGVSIGRVRKIMQSLGFLGPAFFLSVLPGVTQPWQAVVCMCCSQGMDAFSQSGLYSNHADIGPRYAGVLLGISNTAGVLAGVAGTYVTGWLVQNVGWSSVWYIAVGLNVFGTIWYCTLAKGVKILD